MAKAGSTYAYVIPKVVQERILGYQKNGQDRHPELLEAQKYQRQCTQDFGTDKSV